jgi:flavocytochrome c
LRKLVSLLLVLSLLVSVAACAPATVEQESTPEPTAVAAEATPSPDASPKYQAGTYTASARGQKGDVTVETVFSDDAIVSVTVVSENETVRVAAPALERIPAAIVEHQSLAVDAISSVTVTSNAIKSAVAECVKQAGGDPNALYANGPQKSPQSDYEVETDVIVVGAGLAGLISAMSALDQGAEVVVLEANDVAGGSSKYSGGFITGVGTDLQKSLGVEDSVDAFMEYWVASVSQCEREDHTDLDAVRAMIERSASDVDYMNEHGIGLQEPTGFGGPMPRWHFSDWRKDFMDGAVAGGVDHIVRCVSYLEERDVPIHYATTAKELITDGSGAVIGVKAVTDDGTKITFKGNSVVLATGGFARNKDLMKRFCPQFPEEWIIPYTSTVVTATGDGIIMAEAVGADVYPGWWMDLSVMVQPGHFEEPINSFSSYNTYFFTDGTGKRLFNANAHYGVRSMRITEAYNETGAVWTIVDGNATGVEICEEYVGKGQVFKADTIEELAVLTGMDQDTLVASVARYNEMVAAGQDADMGQFNLIPLDSPPYYALNCKVCTMGTTGGLKTDEDCRVLNKQGNPIPGLYAAGEVMNGKYFNQIYISGCAQLLCVDSGRIAGAAAANDR